MSMETTTALGNEQVTAVHSAGKAGGESLTPVIARMLGLALLPAADVLALFAGGGLAILGMRPAAEEPIRLAVLSGLVAFALLAGAGLYPGSRLVGHELLRRRVAAMGGGAALAFAIAILLFRTPSIALLSFATLSIALVLQFALRELLLQGLNQAGLWCLTVDIVAPPSRAADVAARLRADWRYGLAPGGSGKARIAVLADVDLIDRRRLAELRSRYNEVLVLTDSPRESASGLQPSDLQGSIALGLRRAATERAGLFSVRRMTDLVIAMPALVAAAPLLAISGLLIWLVDPGPVFYRQVREGLHGKTIRVLKLRTMYRNADRMLAELLERDPTARKEWETHFKLSHDPRLLPYVGRFLRASSLDELPQLLNVVMGDMALVGPRPFPIYHLEAMTPGFRAKRASVVPGLTGLWQVSERSDADVALQERLDEFYIDNRSIWFDAALLLATVRAVLRRTGA